MSFISHPIASAPELASLICSHCSIGMYIDLYIYLVGYFTMMILRQEIETKKKTKTVAERCVSSFIYTSTNIYIYINCIVFSLWLVLFKCNLILPFIYTLKHSMEFAQSTSLLNCTSVQTRMSHKRKLGDINWLSCPPRAKIN